MGKAKGKPPNPVTDADAQAFHGYMLKWQALLNLNDWRVEPSEMRSKSMAEVLLDSPAHLAAYKVGADFGAMPVTPASLESTAVHELLHVRLHDLIAAAAGADQELINGAEHAVINVFEKLLMDKYAG